MKHKIYSTLQNWYLTVLLTASIFSALNTKAQTSHSDKIHIGFIYPISSHGTHAVRDTNNFSFHLLSGVSAGENGVSFAGFSTVVKNDVNGVSFAGFSNHIGKNAEGVLFAGFVNTYGSAKGVQFAGFSNVAAKNVEGAQFSGFLNKAGDVKGFQFAGFSNVSDTIAGSQFAGFINVAKYVKDFQFSGFANITSKSVNGSQFAGFINKADTVKGSQFAGFINIAKKVKGAQIAGFINIADSSDYPIGIINLVKSGEKSIGLSIDENQTTLISFRSGGKALYGIIGLGYNFKNDDEVYAFEAGLGAHCFNKNAYRLNVELSSTTLESFKSGNYFKSSLRVLPAIKIGQNVEIFGGPSLNVILTNTSEGKTLIKNYTYEHQNSRNDNFQALYIGYSAGLNFRFN